MKLTRNKRSTRRLWAVVLSLVMVMGCVTLPVMAAEEGIMPISEDNTHVLEASALTAFDAGAKADGDTETVGDYFTVIYSAKSKVDASSKTWDDGYASDQRVNFGGKASTEKNAVKFTTSNPATVKIWWAQGGDDNREYAILNAAGEAVVSTSGTYEKNKAYLSTLELDEAGTYFLGGATNNNYLFKIEVTEEPASEKVSTLEANKLTAFAQGDKADGESETVEDYFTILWSAKSKVDGSNKTWDDGYTSGQRINFGGKAGTDKNAVKFTTSGPATVKVWWASGGDRQMVLLNSAGEEADKTSDPSVKNDPYLSTLELAEAGTWFLGGDTGSNYIFKIEVTETVGTKAPRADWADAAAPAVKSVEADATEPGNVTVTVTGEVGYDAADEIRVTMRDANGWEVKTLSSLAEKSEHVLTFTPDVTGTYTFEVAALRADEAEIHKGDKTVSFDFTYPLGVPVMKYAVSDGKGGVTVEWNSVKEATGYIVKAGDKSVTTEGLNATKTAVEGLTLGAEVEVTVAALRGDETGKECEAVKVTVSDKADVAWVFSAFGTSTNTKDNGFEIKEDGSVRVFSLNGKGKVQPSAEDGLAFYYTALNGSTQNFVLTATANVNSWTYSNGQEGFGLLVMDQVGVNGSTAPVWSNSFMLGVTGLSEVSKMRLGVGALARTGVSEFSETKPDSFAAHFLDNLSGVEDDIQNLVGNCTNQEKVDERGKTIDPALTSFKMKLEKNDDGYFVTYTDHKGVSRTCKYEGVLNSVNDDIYVGFFAARNMDVTYSDISLTVTEASGSEVPGGTEEAKTVPSIKFMDPTDSNDASYELWLDANVDGSYTVRKNGGFVASGPIKAGERKTVAVTLAEGANTYIATLTPKASEDIASADPVTTEAHTVTYGVDGREVIYVGPNGKDDAKGTREDPTTLAAAVKCPAPGATIILLEGTYNYTSGVTVARGINGTEEAPITLRAEENAGTRPVLDWGEKGNGLRVNGDWWNLYGFDSTRSTAKGVHVGGNHNVVERVNTYDNLSTGLSISRINFGESIPDWPSYNLILNCSSWLNADAGYEDADGFEAKLTVGEGNVFRGCIAAYNADDGWDLFARGSVIGAVTIEDSIAFKNGIDIVDGKEVDAGNGNGFKLGGGNYPVDHRIVNSIAFANKANGFTCNSNPNVKVENCTGVGNGTGNLALYTNIASLDTAFAVHGFVSFIGGKDDSIKAQGAQVVEEYLNDTNCFQGHISGVAVDASWFKSLDVDKAVASGITRNADGSISMAGFLELTDKAPEGVGADLPGEQEQNYRDTVIGSWYYEAVEALKEKNIMVGVSDSVFAPDMTTSRGMVAAILHRVADKPKAEKSAAFTDVKGGSWYADAADWTQENGYLTGTDGKFDPDGAISRDAMVTAMYLYAKDAGYKVDNGDYTLTGFADIADIADASVDAWTWAVRTGIIQGTDKTDPTLNPAGTTTRAEQAVITAGFLALEK